MSLTGNGLYEFGRFRLDTAERLLLRDGERLKLSPKTFDTLLVLIENAGQLVAKETFMQRVWRGTFVEEGVIAGQISLLRKLLGDRDSDTPLIETVSGYGYRFNPPHSSTLIVRETHTRKHITIDEEKIDAAEDEKSSVVRDSSQSFAPTHAPTLALPPAGILRKRPGARRLAFILAPVIVAMIAIGGVMTDWGRGGRAKRPGS